MAVKGLDEYARKLDRLGAQAPQIAKKAVYAGANVLANKVRENLEGNLQDLSYVGKQSTGGRITRLLKRNRPTGDLLASFGIAPISADDRGNTNTKIGFEGYDHRGIPNALKARAMESGTSELRKRPFVRPAVNAVKGRAQQEMSSVIDEEISKIYAL
jgi:phage protein, HK97 gp10 family